MSEDGLAAAVADLSRLAHARGWALGTSGNFSAVAGRDPLRLLITPSGADKGTVAAADLVVIDGQGARVAGSARPSAESAVHLAVVEARGAGAVCHTHSVWSTLLSEVAAGDGGLAIEGYEMLKGLDGVDSHEHAEWLPVIDNTQDWAGASRTVTEMLRAHPRAHGFLIRRHGLYTWGAGIAHARRHLEVLEFLLEVVGRARSGPTA
jgi:methylthioribulose-1-phosphate dehydratase